MSQIKIEEILKRAAEIQKGYSEYRKLLVDSLADELQFAIKDLSQEEQEAAIDSFRRLVK